MPTNDSLHNLTGGFDTLPLPPKFTNEPTFVIIKDTIVNMVDKTPATGMASNTGLIDLNISVLLVIIILGLAVGLFFLLAFLKKYMVPVFVQRYQKKNIQLFWYRFTVVVWVVFGLLALYLFLKASVLITVLILLFSGVLFHQFITDFMVGIYFQFENEMSVSDHFKFNNIEGTIQAFNSRHIKAITNDSEEVYIPYRNLLSTPIHIVKEVDSLVERRFEITLVGESAKNLQLLEKHMTMCPWIYESNLFKINSLGNDIYSVSVRVKEEFTANKIESFIKSKLK